MDSENNNVYSISGKYVVDTSKIADGMLRKMSPIPSEASLPKSQIDQLETDMRALKINMTKCKESVAMAQVSYERLEQAHEILKLAVLNLQIALGKKK